MTMVLRVSVPVLSLHRMFIPASSSTDDSRTTMAPCFASSRLPMASVVVHTWGGWQRPRVTRGTGQSVMPVNLASQAVMPVNIASQAVMPVSTLHSHDFNSQRDGRDLLEMGAHRSAAQRNPRAEMTNNHNTQPRVAYNGPAV